MPSRKRKGVRRPTRRHFGFTGEFALTPPEVEQLLIHAQSWHDEALLKLAISTGIRREDIVAIPIEGVDLEAGRIRFYENKKRRDWEVHVGGSVLVTLKKHLNSLPKGARWLFPGRQQGGSHLSGRSAYNILARSLRNAGLRTRPFHALRATCIKLAQWKGWTPEQVAKLTGDSIRVIQQHYSTPSRDEMQKVAVEKPLL